MYNMKSVTFNNLIALEYPDDFKQLSDEENEKYFYGDQPRLSFQNKEKHILFSISKSKDAFINRLISIKAVAIGSLTNLENNLKEYKFIEEKESLISDKPSLTECFSYIANDKDIKQYGELTIFKIGKAFYNIHCISRFDDKEECQAIFKQFRNSFKSIN